MAGALFAALDQPLAGRQIQLALGFVAAMALQAVLAEQATDLAFEQLETGRHLGGMVGRNVGRTGRQVRVRGDESQRGQRAEKRSRCVSVGRTSLG